jgi:hypothetical protein
MICENAMILVDEGVNSAERRMYIEITDDEQQHTINPNGNQKYLRRVREYMVVRHRSPFF